MADIISNNIETYKSLSTIYEEIVVDTLKEPRNKLEKVFTELLNTKGKEYSLQKENSVYTSKFYHIKSRIKEPDNFYEKLIRKNIGLMLTNKYDLILTQGNINTRKGEIISEIQNLDDIIGLRIVTELKKDCKRVYELLENSGDFFKEKQVVFIDLKGQPQKMKNGLDIYRIKGIFQGIFGFELQIKSKIDEAWGDLDHTLFYKDYSISPIKDTVQVTMNNVGELLDRIEHLLYDLRESGSNYKENADHLKFQEELEDEVSVLLKNKFNTPYRLKEIAHYLRHFRKILEIGENKLQDIDYSHLGWPGTSPFTQAYLKIRDSHFDLIVLETLFFNWRKLIGKGDIVPANYEIDVNEYLSILADFIAGILEENSGSFLDYLKNMLQFSTSSDLFLSTAKHAQIKEVINRLSSMSADDDEIKSYLEEIKMCYQIMIFNGDITSYLKPKLEDGKIEDGLFKVRAIVKESKNEIDKKIDKISSDILEIVRKLNKDELQQ